MSYFNISFLKLVPFSNFGIFSMSNTVAYMSENVSLIPRFIFSFICFP